MEPDFERFVAGRRTLLDGRLLAVEARAATSWLPGVTITGGVLKITPIAKTTPPQAEVLAGRLYAMLPRIRVTDLLTEVAAGHGLRSASPTCAPARSPPTAAS